MAIEVGGNFLLEMRHSWIFLMVDACAWEFLLFFNWELVFLNGFTGGGMGERNIYMTA